MKNNNRLIAESKQASKLHICKLRLNKAKCRTFVKKTICNKAFA